MGRSSKWNDQTILEAIERFRSLNGTYPTSHDFQFTDYLPDPSTIRVLYGGLPEFRKKFGFDVEDYTKGQVRSDLNRSLNDRAKAHEEKILKVLVDRFGEVCVHKEREFAYRNRVDFQVYHADGIFGVDTFFPKSRIALINIFNLKYPKYKNYLIGPVFLVCMNTDLNQETLNSYLANKKLSVGENIQLLTESNFLAKILSFNKRVKL